MRLNTKRIKTRINETKATIRYNMEKSCVLWPHNEDGQQPTHKQIVNHIHKNKYSEHWEQQIKEGHDRFGYHRGHNTGDMMTLKNWHKTSMRETKRKGITSRCKRDGKSKAIEWKVIGKQEKKQ